MGTCDLLDVYYVLSPWASDIHIRQIPHAHVTTIACNMYIVVTKAQVHFLICTRASADISGNARVPVL